MSFPLFYHSSETYRQSLPVYLLSVLSPERIIKPVQFLFCHVPERLSAWLSIKSRSHFRQRQPFVLNGEFLNISGEPPEMLSNRIVQRLFSVQTCPVAGFLQRFAEPEQAKAILPLITVFKRGGLCPELEAEGVNNVLSKERIHVGSTLLYVDDLLTHSLTPLSFFRPPTSDRQAVVSEKHNTPGKGRSGTLLSGCLAPFTYVFVNVNSLKRQHLSGVKRCLIRPTVTPSLNGGAYD
ncbi:hypothetical protein [Pantoea agglomerans]|uniref:Uncharacterized protein n=1 Tax=Enterobacter agglomerans TaxID=549 RepID=A0AAN2K6L6_ENTAG|nr:hypothetical protein [Pantoea agglomerans]CAH6335425.1 hypothetical protein DAPPPG734_18625 [Pantoea agglomerans]